MIIAGIVLLTAGLVLGWLGANSPIQTAPLPALLLLAGAGLTLLGLGGVL